MTRKRTLITHAVAFAAGCLLGSGALVALGAYLVETESEHERAASLLKRWGAYMDEDRFLTIPLPGKGMLVRIWPDGARPPSDAADIEILKEKVGAIFSYRLEGKWGLPSARYAGGVVGTGHDWVDYNVDGLFDFHGDFAQKVIEIRTQDGWVTAHKSSKDRAVTSEGTFTFDAEAGQWKRVKD